MSDLIKYTKEAFLTKFEPMRMSKEIRAVKNVADAINSDPNGLSFYRKQIGEDTVMAVIELHLLSLGQSVNVHEKLSKFQIQEIASEIITLYYYMNMTEITYVFRKAKRGEYGVIKYALNMPEVLQWFSSYAEERISHCMKQSEQGDKLRKNEHIVKNGKLVNQLSKKIAPEIIERLGKVKDEIPKGFDKEEFKEWKNEKGH
jgi:polyhydroxyalkanoate synthesis regulator phasin